MIQIGFNTSNALISRIIRFFTRQEVSHAFIVYDDEEFGGKFVLEANWDGYHVKPYEEAVKGSTKIILVEPRYNVTELLKVCSQWLGKPYDYPGLVGNVPVMISRWFKKKAKNPTQNPKAMFCSEAIAVALQKIGYPGADELDASTTTPQDLLDFFKSE